MGGIIAEFIIVEGVGGVVFAAGDSGDELIDFLDHGLAGAPDLLGEEELATEDRGEAGGGGVTWVAVVFFLGAHAFGEIPFEDRVIGGGVIGADGGIFDPRLGVGGGGVPESAFGAGIEIEFGGFVVGPESDASGGEIGFPLGGFFFAWRDDDLDIARGAGGFGGGEGAVFEDVEPFEGHGDASGGEFVDREAFDIGVGVFIEGELASGVEVIAVEDRVNEEFFGGIEGIGAIEIGDGGIEIGVEGGLRFPGSGAGGWREIGGESGIKTPLFDEGIGGVKLIGFGGFA